MADSILDRLAAADPAPSDTPLRAALRATLHRALLTGARLPDDPGEWPEQRWWHDGATLLVALSVDLPPPEPTAAESAVLLAHPSITVRRLALAATTDSAALADLVVPPTGHRPSSAPITVAALRRLVALAATTPPPRPAALSAPLAALVTVLARLPHLALLDTPDIAQELPGALRPAGALPPTERAAALAPLLHRPSRPLREIVLRALIAPPPAAPTRPSRPR